MTSLNVIFVLFTPLITKGFRVLNIVDQQFVNNWSISNPGFISGSALLKSVFLKNVEGGSIAFHILQKQYTKG